MKLNKCLVCQELTESGVYHPKCAKNLFGTIDIPTLEFSAKDIEAMAKDVINRRLALQGVQKKLSLHLEQNGSHKVRLTIVGALGGTHILKPPTPEYPEMPELENLTMLLASKCGIKTAAYGLVQMKDHSFAYLTRRFDRTVRNKKIAVEDLCQLSELPTESKYRSTSEKAGKIIRKYSSNPGDDALRFFELIVFSFVVGNTDMHLKNFSLMETKDGMITLSPAYDLLATHLLLEDNEELALQVNGTKTKIKTKDFGALAQNLQIPNKVWEGYIYKLISLRPALQQTIKNSFLSEGKKEQFSKLIDSRCLRLSDK